jgi:sugar transferase (PEP-CTERM/EpsH1 system associated)
LVRSVTVGRVPRFRNMVRAGLGLVSSTPLTHLLLDTPELAASIDRHAAANRPDVVFCFCTGVGPIALRPSLAGIPMILDMVDVDSAKWLSVAKTSPFPLSLIYKREARLMAQFEVDISTKAARTLVTTSEERLELRKLSSSLDPAVLEVGVDTDYYRRPPDRDRSADVVFCGVMNYKLNVEGVLWFATNVWPLVRKEHPSATFTIVGADPTASIRRLALSNTGIRVTGTVPDVRPHLWSASVSIAPLLTARGVQTKVLEAFAAGLPVVVTPQVAKGLPVSVLNRCVVAEAPDSFARAIVTALESRATDARANVNDLTWGKQLAPLKSMVQAVLPR